MKEWILWKVSNWAFRN